MKPYLYGKVHDFDTALLTLASRDRNLTPTLAAGDVMLSIDNAALATITSLPSVAPAGSGIVKVLLSAAETVGRKVSILFKDQTAPADWEEQMISLERASVADDMIEQKVDSGFEERTGVVSAAITKAGYPDYGVIYTGSASPAKTDLNTDILTGMVIRDEVLGTEYVILGGYYFDFSDSKSYNPFGVCLDTVSFGVVDGVATQLNTLSWVGAADETAGSESGWTFVIQSTQYAYPSSTVALSLWLDIGQTSDLNISNQAVINLRRIAFDNDIDEAIKIDTSAADSIFIDPSTWSAVHMTSAAGAPNIGVVRIDGSTSGIYIQPSVGGNFDAIKLLGRNAGAGLNVAGGVTGDAFQLAAGATSGDIISGVSVNGMGINFTTLNQAVKIYNNSSEPTFDIANAGSGEGISSLAATGIGLAIASVDGGAVWINSTNDEGVRIGAGGDGVIINASNRGLRIDSNTGSSVVITSVASNAVEATAGGNGAGFIIRGAGTGYDIDAPNSDLGINIAAVGGAITTNATGVTVNTGTPTGAYTATYNDDGSYQEIDHAGNEVDVEYQFNVGGNGLPTGFTFVGFLNAVIDDIAVEAQNWGTGFENIGTISGQASSINIEQFFTLFARHVGTGANLGEVHIRFYKTGGGASLSLNSDQLYVTYAALAQSVGYANGAIWIDDSVSNTNTEAYVDGVADNPVSTWAAAKTLSAALGLKKFAIANGTTITLDSDSSNFSFFGDNWTLALGGQIITGLYSSGASITGVSSGTGFEFRGGIVGTCTIDVGDLIGCGIAGDITLLGAGTYYMDQCYSGVAGTATPSIDFGAAVANTNLNVRHYSGGIEVKEMGSTGTDNMSLEGDGQLKINASCDPSNSPVIAIRGCFKVTDSVAGGFVAGGGTIAEVARYGTDQLAAFGGGMAPGYTIDGAIDNATSQKMILAYCSGKIVRTADAYDYYNNAGAVIVFTLNGASGGRTRT